MQISKNFNSISDNMQCPCCNAFVYKEHFINRVQILRDLVGVPFSLTKKGGGFYRCSIYNESIGGAKNSQHLLGNAMDVLTHGWSGDVKWEFIREATALKLSLGLYNSFFHIDYRSSPVMWYGG